MNIAGAQSISQICRSCCFIQYYSHWAAAAPGIGVLQTVGVVLFTIPTQNLQCGCPILLVSNPRLFIR